MLRGVKGLVKRPIVLTVIGLTVVSLVLVQILPLIYNNSHAAASYHTDEPAKCTVEFTRGISGDAYDNKTPDEETLINSHINIISGLVPSAPYHLRIICLDKSNNRAVSPAQTITSGAVQESIFSIILKTLNSLFGWLQLH